MALRIRRVWHRLALLLAAAAVLPLGAYGVASVVSLDRSTRATVTQGNLNVSARAAEEISRYVQTNAELLKALAADLKDTGLSLDQQDRIVKGWVLQMRQFHEITRVDAAGRVLATSRAGAPRLAPPTGPAGVTLNGVAMSPLRLDQDMLPTVVFAVPLSALGEPAGWLLGEFSLEEMWRMVDDIRIGADGYALVLDRDGTLIAHGSPDEKALVAKGVRLTDHPLVSTVPRQGTAPRSLEYSARGRDVLGVAARIPSLGWSVIVEQPTAEAYAAGTLMRQRLYAAIGLALLLVVAAGYGVGRSFIRPILLLKQGTQGVAEGRLDTRVALPNVDEFGGLGQAFNTMAQRLGELQEDVKRQERQATFGRVAAGLVHDLSHPIQNIGNAARLMVHDAIDDESREVFRRTIDREVVTLKRFMDDLRNMARPQPVERFALDVNASVAEIVEPMRAEAERHGLTLESRYAEGPLVIEGDRFALGRVYRNLVTNAVQATAAGGRVEVTTRRVDAQVEVSVLDTGAGIAPERLAKIFDDFVTTKRNGLGLGLAISKRIVEQLDGTIGVSSEVGRGTVFTLRFPARDDLTARAAAS